MKNKINIIGCFGYHNNQLDGQTIKSRCIYEIVRSHDYDVRLSDTQEIRIDKSKIGRFISNILHCKTIVLIPGANNVKVLFPIIFCISKLLGHKIILIAVGGWLDNKYRQWKLHRFIGKKVDATLVENNRLVTTLKDEFGIKNVEKIPNFRAATSFYPKENVNGPLRLVFMARVHKNKGLEYIENLAKHIEDNYKSGQISIDFYGQINPADEGYFLKELVNKYKFIEYHGVLAPDDIVEVLHRYDAMLLPTKYYTEGLPGSILDAYRSSLPVIVTKWKFADEFVTDGITGFILPFENPNKLLCEKIDWLYNNREELYNLQKGAYQESINYTPEKAWEILSKYL